MERIYKNEKGQYAVWCSDTDREIPAFRDTKGLTGKPLMEAILNRDVVLNPDAFHALRGWGSIKAIVQVMVEDGLFPSEDHPDFMEKVGKNGWTWTHLPTGKSKFFHRRTVEITETRVGNLQEFGWRNRPTGQEVARDMERVPNTWN